MEALDMSARSSVERIERPTRESLAKLRAAREQFLSDPGSTDLSEVRDVIARSWLRSVACKVDPETISVESRDIQIEAPLLNIAMPVVERLGDLAKDSGAAVVLCDAAGTIAAMRGDKQVLDWAGSRLASVGAYLPEEVTGTNSDGTALEESASVQVWGPEHFSEEFQETFCTSVLIRDALRRRVAGVLTLMVPQSVALITDPGSLSMIVEGAAAEINYAAINRLANREQALLTAYMRESRMRGAEAVLAIDERTTIASNRAQDILLPDDYAVVSAYAHEAVKISKSLDRAVSLSGERPIKLTARPVIVDGDSVGAVVRLREHDDSHGRSSRERVGQNQVGAIRELPGFVGESTVIAHTRTAAASALSLRNAVVITGERGTGRTHLAKLMAASRAVPWRLIGQSEEGDRELDVVAELRTAAEADEMVVMTHLDEMAEADLEAAKGLLRAASAQGRLLATAHQFTQDLVELFGPEGPAEIKVPPLRSRRDDIPGLVAYFLAEAGRNLTPSGRLLHALTQADWPGNVAALRAVLLSAAKNSTTTQIDVADLGDGPQQALARGRLTRLEAAELEQIRHALAEARGNRVRAAELLEIGRSTLYRKIDRYSRKGFDLGT